MAKQNTQPAPLPPFVDERILIRGTSYLRTLDADALEAMEPGTVIVGQNGAEAKRLSVLLRYEDFMTMQRAALRAV